MHSDFTMLLIENVEIVKKIKTGVKETFNKKTVIRLNDSISNSFISAMRVLAAVATTSYSERSIKRQTCFPGN